MQYDHQDDEVVDLGAASAETKGIVGVVVDLPGGIAIAGILND